VTAEAHRPGCVCGSCIARRRAEARLALVKPRVLVDSGATAEHIAQLRKSGRSLRSLARQSGLSPAVMVKAARLGEGLNLETAERILALR
jgi:hypothetical protein